MKHPTVFDLFSDIFKKADIKCVLIGGFAVNHYKVTRDTIDVDFLCTKESYNKINNLLNEEGYIIKRIEENFVQLRNERNLLMDVDFMFVSQETLDKIEGAGVLVSIAGKKFKIPSLLHLIALKFHSIKNNPKREITDLPDVVRLIVNNDVDVDNSDFKNICLKYGTKELYKRIKTIVK